MLATRIPDGIRPSRTNQNRVAPLSLCPDEAASFGDTLPRQIQRPPFWNVHRQYRFKQPAVMRIAQVEQFMGNHEIPKVWFSRAEVDSEGDGAER